MIFRPILFIIVIMAHDVIIEPFIIEHFEAGHSP